MSIKVKRLLKKIVRWSGVVFFFVAIFMIYYQLKDYSLIEVLKSIKKIPLTNLFYASLASLFGYITLSIYDFIALKYVQKKVSWWKWMLAGMLGFAISNNAGHAVVSGGAIRYRLYTRWRVTGGEIFKMLIFSGFTYFLGCVSIVILGYFLVPHELFSNSLSASIGIHSLFVFCLLSLILYFLMTILFKNKTVRFGQLNFKVPKTKMAIIQSLLGTADSILAGLVLYFCLIPFVDIPFGVFIGIFVISQTTGVFSQVPGGIGVFESVFLLAFPGNLDKLTVFGSLIAFRIIYYLLPLIGSGGLFIIYERWLRSKMKLWLSSNKK